MAKQYCVDEDVVSFSLSVFGENESVNQVKKVFAPFWALQPGWTLAQRRLAGGRFNRNRAERKLRLRRCQFLQIMYGEGGETSLCPQRRRLSFYFHG